MPLRVRNASPERPPSLNSMRSTESMQRREPAQEPERGFQTGFVPAAAPYGAPVAQPQSQPPTSPSQPETGRNERLRNFFTADRAGEANAAPQKPFVPQKMVPQIQKEKPPKVTIPHSKRMHSAFLFFGLLSALCVIGVGAFLFLPKVELHVFPHKTTQNVDMQLSGYIGTPDSATDSLPVRIAERKEEVSLSAKATGSSASNSQKARGTVIISNSFSSESQSLVATTRLETADGKLFRLVDTVTVPGMGSEPGVIEAAVIADQAGEQYNIDPTSFTIPGFKGSPKFDKFSAKSLKKMQGGGNDGSGTLAIISKADLDKAESDAKEEAKKRFLTAAGSELKQSEKILEESIEVTKAGTGSVPPVGTAAEAFDYAGSYTVKAFILSEDAVLQKIAEKAGSSLSGTEFEIAGTKLSYGEITPNYAEGTVRVKAHAEVVLQSKIDEAELKASFAGKGDKEIQAALDGFPEIKRLNLVFKPDWFVSSIPDSLDRIEVVIEPGEE